MWNRPRPRPRPALPTARAALPPALALRPGRPAPRQRPHPPAPHLRRPVPGPESGRSGAVMVLNLIRKCKHQTGDMSSRLTAPGRRWPGAARMWAWPAGVGPTRWPRPPISLAASGPPLTARRPAPSPPRAGPPLHPQHELQTQHLGLFRGVCCQAGGTTPLVGRSGTDVSGTQGSVTSRWRRLSREGAWGPSGG